jgi:hypothetical protein
MLNYPFNTDYLSHDSEITFFAKWQVWLPPDGPETHIEYTMGIFLVVMADSDLELLMVEHYHSEEAAAILESPV